MTNNILDNIPILNQQLQIHLKSEGSYVKFWNLLPSDNWNSVCSTNDVEIISEHFFDEPFTVYIVSFSLIQIEEKLIDIWNLYIDENLRELMAQKHKLEKKFRRHPLF